MQYFLEDLLRYEFKERYEDLRNTLPKSTEKRFTNPLSRLTAYTVHHSGPGIKLSTTWYDIAKMHIEDRNFAGIGYHLGIARGKVSYLGDIRYARAHVVDKNHMYVGVCLMGNFDVEIPDALDTQLLVRLLRTLDKYYEKIYPLGGHRDFAPYVGYTQCPGNNLYKILPELDIQRRIAKEIDVSTEIRKAVWEKLGIAFNENTYFYKTAARHNLGHPVTNEFDVTLSDGKLYRVQAFDNGIVFAPVISGFVDLHRVTVIEWFGPTI